MVTFLLCRAHSLQNFNENLSILTMLLLYAALVWFDVHIYVVIVAFGAFVSIVMTLIRKWHVLNQSKEDSLHLIGEKKLH